jgi:predicted Zn-dependent peptidase
MRELLEIFADIRRRPPEERELSRVIRTYLYDLEFSRDHTDDMAMRYGWGELVGYLRTLEEDRRAIAAITPEDLHATARELFSPSRLKVVVVGPCRRTHRSRVTRLLEEYR